MNIKPYKDIGARLLWHRESLDLQQKDYAALIGAKRSIYSLWESGSNRITVDYALKLRDRYGLSLDFIYAGNADALPTSLRNAWQSRPSLK